MNGIIFDVDGTLWDSTETVAQSWNQAIKEQSDLEKRVTGTELMGEFGKPLEVIMSNLFPMLTEEQRISLSIHLFNYENRLVAVQPCKIYEGVAETIRKLSDKYPLFIVSNCQAGYIEAFLQNTGLGSYFTDYTCPGDTGMLKGDNIRLIMKRNGLKQGIYVGDTQGDADACEEAGIPMIFAAYGFGKVQGEFRTIYSFPELLTIDYENIK
ncbi:MAG: HAD family hydrolase [Lachnospiraceae bacterium]